jgi:hypothetical protein
MFPNRPRGRLQNRIIDIFRRNLWSGNELDAWRSFTRIGDGEFFMATQPRLPARFPVGTRYVVEGEPVKGGKLRILSRYLVMPSGVRYDLMNVAEPVRKPEVERKSGPRSAQRRRAM